MKVILCIFYIKLFVNVLLFAKRQTQNALSNEPLFLQQTKFVHENLGVAGDLVLDNERNRLESAAFGSS
jgi:hypothetical protein